MSIKFKSSIESEGKIIQSKHRAIKHTDTVQTLEVKVVTKTAAHPEHGNGSSYGYTIDGVEGAYLELTPGITYRFDQSDVSNGGTGTGGGAHPLAFYEDAAKTTAYNTQVTTNGSPGSSGAYTQIIPTTSTPPILFYQCTSHALMGSYAKFGTGTVGDTYSINVATDGSNVDLNLDAASGTDSTVQLTAGSNITLTRNDAQQVTIAASGGALTIQDEGSALSTAATTLNFTGSGVTASGTGATKTINVTGGGSSGGTVTVEKNVYTANGSTAAFNTSSAIANENNVQVYIDGVYQSKDDYTASGSTITLDANPANGAIVELIHIVAVSGVIARDSFTGDGSTTAYVLSMSIANENATQVYIDGVYQSKNNYSTSGSTLTFSTAPTNGTAIEVVHLKAVNATSINQNSFTGDGSDTTFTLSQSISDENKTFVFIQGVYQEKSTYSISGTTLTFSTAPQNGYSIEVMTFDSITIGNQVVGGGTDWQSTIQTSNFTAAAGKGYFVDTASGAITVSLPAGSAGDEIHFTDYSGNFGSNEIIFDANGSQKILGTTDNHKCITENATVRLIYQNDTKGWTADNIATTALVINFLVVAGGGGAGRGGSYGEYYGGGGGGGGFRSSTDGRGGGQSSDAVIIATSGTNYTVTVGAGGAGVTSAIPGNTGSDSIFATITSKGGGGGGANDATGDGLDGGSGGGAGGNDDDNYGGHAVTSPVVHGYDGGDEVGNSTSRAGAGGGGAGSVGSDASTLVGATGGAAKLATITGSNVYYAAGGGGKRGWGGSDGVRGANGTGNTNSGDGGHLTVNSGNASAGVVVLQYASNITLTIGSGLTSSTATVGSNKVTTFTAGTGNVQFS